MVRAPRALDLVAADLLRPAPALRRPEHDHRPARPLGRAALHARLPLDRADVGDHRVERRRHLRVHLGGIIALDEVRRVAVAAEQGVELVVADPGKHRRVGDLVAVEVQDRQHRTVPGRVDELVRMPCGGERAGLSLAIADDAGDDEVGVVERRAIGVRQAIAELAALVDRARRLRGDVRADVAGEGELLEEPPEPFEVLALVGIGLGVGALEIGRPEDARRAVAGPGHEDHVEIVTTDHTVEVRPDKGERRAGAPVAEQPPLHVLGLQRLPQQRVVGAGRSSRPTGSCRHATTDRGALARPRPKSCSLSSIRRSRPFIILPGRRRRSDLGGRFSLTRSLSQQHTEKPNRLPLDTARPTRIPSRRLTA